MDGVCETFDVLPRLFTLFVSMVARQWIPFCSLLGIIFINYVTLSLFLFFLSSYEFHSLSFELAFLFNRVLKSTS